MQRCIEMKFQFNDATSEIIRRQKNDYQEQKNFLWHVCGVRDSDY